MHSLRTLFAAAFLSRVPGSNPRWRQSFGLCLAALTGTVVVQPLFAAEIKWTLGSDGFWHTVGAWSPKTPTNSDNVTNDTAYTITHDSDNDAINSFLSSASGGFVMSGGSLLINKSFRSNGAVALNGGTLKGNAGSTLRVDNAFTMNGGTLKGFTVNPGNDGSNTYGISFAYNNNNFLDGVTMNAHMDLTASNAVARILNGLTLNARADLKTYGVLSFQGDQTLDGTGSIVFGINNSAYSQLAVEGNSTLTIGSKLLIHGGAGYIGTKVYDGNPNAILNNGRILADVHGNTLTVAANTLTNNGTLEARNGATLNLYDGTAFTNKKTVVAREGSAINVSTASLTNNSTLEARDGSILTLAPTVWNKVGVLKATGYRARVNLQGGTITLGSGDAFKASGGGYFTLSTKLDNTGKTFDPLATGGAFWLVNGNITNGTLKNANKLLFSRDYYNFLDGVSAKGGLDLTNGGYVRIRNSFGTDKPILIDNSGLLAFEGDRTFDAAKIVFGDVGGNVTVEGAASLTLGSKAILQGKNASIGNRYFDGTGSNTLLNQTTLSSELGGTWYVYGGTLQNQGTLRADNSSTLNTYNSAFLNDTSGKIVAQNGASLAVNTGTFTNNGTIQANDGGVVNLNASTWNKIGKISATGYNAVVHLYGGALNLGTNDKLSASGGGGFYLHTTLDNTGKTFDPVATGGYFVLSNGAILNGTLKNANKLLFSRDYSNFLDGVSAKGGLDLTNGGYVRIRNSFSTDKPILLDNGSIISFHGDRTFDAMKFVFGDVGGNLGIEGAATGIFTSNAVLQGKNASIGNRYFDGTGSNTLLNQTTLSSELGGTWYVYGGTLQNQGTLRADNSSTLNTNNTVFVNDTSGTVMAQNGASLSLNTGTFTNNGAIVAASGSNLYLNASAWNKLGALSSIGPASILHLSGSTISLNAGDTLTTSNGGAIYLHTSLDNTGKTFDPLSIGGNFVLVNGGIANGNITHSDSLVFSRDGNNYLSGVTADNGLNLTNGGYVRIYNAFTPGGTVRLGNGGIIAYYGKRTLDGTFDFGGGGSLSAESNSVMTLAPSAVLQGVNASIGNRYFDGTGNNTLINQTTLSSQVPGGYWAVQSNNLINKAVIQALNGGRFDINAGVVNNAGTISVGAGSQLYLYYNNSLTNSGLMEADAGGTLFLYANRWSNVGTIRAVGKNAVVNLGGTFTNNGTLAAQDGGSFALNGTLNNAFRTFDPTTIGGTFNVSSGIIYGGTVNNANGLSFTRDSNNALDGVTANGGIDVTNGGYVRLRNGTTPGGLILIDRGGIVALEGNYTLDSTKVVFGNSGNGTLSMEGYGTLTLGNKLQIQGTSLTLGQQRFYGGYNTLINNTMLSSEQGGTWNVYAGYLTNNATMQADQGSAFSIYNSSGTFTNNGTILAKNKSNLNLYYGTLTNNATMEAQSGSALVLSPQAWGKVGTLKATGANSTVYLQGGTIGLGTSDKLTASGGGSFVLQTTLDNNGKTFDPVATGGTFRIVNGVILNGKITHANNLVFSQDYSNALDGVTASGGLDLSNGGYVRLRNGTTPGGTVNIDHNGLLAFEGTQTFDAAKVVFGTKGSGTLSIEGYGALTLGSKLQVQGTSLTLGQQRLYGGYNTLVNNTTLSSERGGTWNVYASYLTNNATMQADNRSALSIYNSSGTFTNNATVLAKNASVLGLYYGTLTNNATMEAQSGSALVLSPQAWGKVGTLKATGVNSRVYLQGGTLSLNSDDVLQASGGGQFFLQTTLDNTNKTFDAGAVGSFRLTDGRLLNGTVNNSNALSFGANYYNLLDGVAANGGLDLSNGGYVRLQNGATVTGGTVTVDHSGRLALQNDYSADGFNVNLNLGYLSIEGNSTLTLGANSTLQALNATVGGQYYTGGTNNLVNNGKIIADRAGLNIVTSNFTNNGSMEVKNTANLSVSTGNMTNTGTIAIGNSATFYTGNTLTQTGGSLKVNGGLVLNPSNANGLFDIQGGSVSGSGQIFGNVSNAGTLSAGDGIGDLFISGNYTQTGAGTLLVELGGYTPGDDFDVLDIGGTMSLDGTLDIKLLDGFKPKDGDTFEIATCGAISGNFASIQALDTNWFYSLSFDDELNSLFLTVTQVGMNAHALHLQGVLMQNGFAAPTPEPGSVALGLCGAATAFWMFRRRKQQC